VGLESGEEDSDDGVVCVVAVRRRRQWGPTPSKCKCWGKSRTKQRRTTRKKRTTTTRRLMWRRVHALRVQYHVWPRRWSEMETKDGGSQHATFRLRAVWVGECAAARVNALGSVSRCYSRKSGSSPPRPTVLASIFTGAAHAPRKSRRAPERCTGTAAPPRSSA
jgi:hypothetical protein